MNLLERKVQMDCTLTLTERETEMLGHLAGYGPQAISELIHAHLSSKYDVTEWTQFWNAMRHELEHASTRFAATRKVFTGQMRAVDLERK